MYRDGQFLEEEHDALGRPEKDDLRVPRAPCNSLSSGHEEHDTELDNRRQRATERRSSPPCEVSHREAL